MTETERLAHEVMDRHMQYASDNLLFHLEHDDWDHDGFCVCQDCQHQRWGYLDCDGHIRIGRDYPHARILEPKRNVSHITNEDTAALFRGVRNGLIIGVTLWALIIWRMWPFIRLWIWRVL